MDQPEHLKKWVDFAKSHKAVCVKCDDRGDITPTVILERDGEVLAIISAPDVDKHQGLNIAEISQFAFDADYLTILLDTHIHMSDLNGQTPEQATEEYHKKYPKGLQAACDEEGACDLGEISDCLLCHRIDKAGNIEMVFLPYAYHGKGGPPFRWLDDEKYKETLFKSSVDGEVQGLIPDSLREIMKKKGVTAEIPELMSIAEQFEFSEERARFHTARAAMFLLAERGCLIKDFMSSKHPEWIDFMPKAIDFVEKSIAKGMFPKEARQPMLDVIENHLGKATFADEFAALLKSHSYWLPAEIRGDEENFSFVLENWFMSPAIPGVNDDPFANKDESGVPDRVRVWNGTQTEYLGEGNYVGEATVYFIRMPDGSIQSLHDAEVEPDPSVVPDGCVVVCSESNPKFMLDSGDVVYGCQIWWEPVDVSEKPHKKGFGGWNKAK